MANERPDLTELPVPPDETEISAAEDCALTEAAPSDSERKPSEKRSGSGGFMSSTIFYLRKLLVFGMPLITLALYIGFYVLLIPALYGEAVSFFDWIFADVEHIGEILGGLHDDLNTVLVPTYVIVLLVILQYVLLAAFVVSVFFFAKELHKPKAKLNKNVKYTGKQPQQLLENAWAELKARPEVFGSAVSDELALLVRSLKYGKPFGVTKDEKVTGLEVDICCLIDKLQDAIAESADGSADTVMACVTSIKQKSGLRDLMLKK